MIIQLSIVCVLGGVVSGDPCMESQGTSDLEEASPLCQTSASTRAHGEVVLDDVSAPRC